MESKHLPLGIIRVFEEFIKGITYFQKEEENKKKKKAKKAEGLEQFLDDDVE